MSKDWSQAGPWDAILQNSICSSRAFIWAMIQLRFGEGLGDNKTSLISLAEASKIMLFYLMFFMLSTAQNNALKLASCLDLTAEYDLLLCEIVLPCESLRIYDTPHLLCALIQEVPKLHLKAPIGGLLQALALETCSVSA
ncbi:unnamed protein product [Brassica oleracea var. botrytis]